MKFCFLAGLLAALVLLSQPAFSQLPGRVDLDGTWQFREQGSKKIYNGTVPGTIQTDLMHNRLIPDPFYRDNQQKVQWVSDTGWVYERYFNLNTDFFSNRNVELVCEGLDTYANVYLNDSLVLVADNMFKEWHIPVKYLLKSGYNRIRIEFPSITKENKRRYEALPYKLPGDEKVVCRKAAYQFGWDFGPTLITMGIWKPIYLRYYNYINMLGTRIVQHTMTNQVASLSEFFTLTSMLADSAEFIMFFDGKEFMRKKVGIQRGVNVSRVDFDIQGPKAWWPNGMGEPTLYEIGYEMWFAGRKVSEGSKKIGLRTVELVQQRDSTGETFFFKINGRAVFAKGANYIPQDNFLPRVTDSMYEAVVRGARDANMNMLRVWGGGIYEKDKFYDLCDEYGIMVWQDFMFAGAMYPGTKEFIGNVRDEVVQNIVRLRDHPSIVLWCGNNEVDEGWRNWGWVKQYGYTPADSAAVADNYHTIFQELLPAAVRRFDTLRPYVSTSPATGWGHPESLKQGDCHYWGVWWGKEPFSAYDEKVGRFMSEYGFQGFPDYSTIRKFTAEEERVPGSEVLKAHEKSPVGFETIDEYLQRDFRIPKDFEQYMYVSQALQAEGVTTAIEAHRRARPYCMGSLFWQLNDCWPAISWSATDYYGTHKALYYRAGKSFSQNLLSPVVENGRVKVYGTSDDLYAQDITLQMVLSDFSGKVIWQKVSGQFLTPFASRVLVDTSLSAVLAGQDSTRVFFYVHMFNQRGFLGNHILFFVPVKDLALEKPSIVKKVTTVPEGYQVEVTTDKLALYVRLSSDIPGEFSDNYFDLIPGEKKYVTFRTRSKITGFQNHVKILSLADTYSP